MLSSDLLKNFVSKNNAGKHTNGLTSKFYFNWCKLIGRNLHPQKVYQLTNRLSSYYLLVLLSMCLFVGPGSVCT